MFNHWIRGTYLLILIAILTPAERVSGQGPTSTRPSYSNQYVDVEFGQDRPVIDTIGNLFGTQRKLLLWDRRIDNHRVSDKTVQDVVGYLSSQKFDDVKVRVNQYDPAGEWRRLVANKRISPGWKYTAGTLNHLRYTLFPGRVWGGDEYNPFTNTVSLYSDVPAPGLAEAAYAGDIHGRLFPGNYAVAQSLPLVAMWHETLATNKVINYIAVRGTPEQIAETRKILYARYGLQVGGEMGELLPDGSQVFQIVGAGLGHLRAQMENKSTPLIRAQSPTLIESDRGSSRR